MRKAVIYGTIAVGMYAAADILSRAATGMSLHEHLGLEPYNPFTLSEKGFQRLEMLAAGALATAAILKGFGGSITAPRNR